MKRKLLGEYNNKVTLLTAQRFNVLPLHGLQPDLCCCHGWRNTNKSTYVHVRFVIDQHA